MVPLLPPGVRVLVLRLIPARGDRSHRQAPAHAQCAYRRRVARAQDALGLSSRENRGRDRGAESGSEALLVTGRQRQSGNSENAVGMDARALLVRW